MIRLVKPFQLYVAVLGKSFRCGFWSHYQIRRAVTPYFHYGWGLSRMSPTLYSSALQHFERGNAIEICNGIMFDFYPGLPHITVNREIFVTCYMKFSLEKFLCWKIFIGSTSYENISTRKFYNIEVGKNVLPWKSFSKEIAFAATTYIKKYGRRRLERRWCICEREPKISSNWYTVAVKNKGTIVEHLPQKLSRVCSLFLQRGKYTVATVSVEREHVEWRGV